MSLSGTFPSARNTEVNGALSEPYSSELAVIQIKCSVPVCHLLSPPSDQYVWPYCTLSCFCLCCFDWQVHDQL